MNADLCGTGSIAMEINVGTGSVGVRRSEKFKEKKENCKEIGVISHFITIFTVNLDQLQCFYTFELFFWLFQL